MNDLSTGLVFSTLCPGKALGSTMGTNNLGPISLAWSVQFRVAGFLGIDQGLMLRKFMDPKIPGHATGGDCVDAFQATIIYGAQFQFERIALRFLLPRFLIVALICSIPASGQTSSGLDAEKGFSEIEAIQGTFNSSAKLFKLDSQLGYDFNKHFGVFTGIPVYITNFSSGTTAAGGTGATGGTNAGLGNFYLGLALRAPNPVLNYGSTITAGAPTGDVKKGLSSGRGTIDWSNHFDRSFGRLTPFFDAGLSNTVSDSALIARPFTSLGKIGHFEEGGEYRLRHHFSAGASAYQIVPFGNQKVFSKLIRQGQGAGSKGAKSRNVFQQVPVASGNDLTRENGFNTWVAFEPAQFWRAEIGYSRSATFDLDSFSFNLGANIGKLLRSQK